MRAFHQRIRTGRRLIRPNQLRLFLPTKFIPIVIILRFSIIFRHLQRECVVRGRLHCEVTVRGRPERECVVRGRLHREGATGWRLDGEGAVRGRPERVTAAGGRLERDVLLDGRQHGGGGEGGGGGGDVLPEADLGGGVGGVTEGGETALETALFERVGPGEGFAVQGVAEGDFLLHPLAHVGMDPEEGLQTLSYFVCESSTRGEEISYYYFLL